MVDLARIKARAAERLAAPDRDQMPGPAAALANPAIRLIQQPPISQLATLASNDTHAQPNHAQRVRLFCRRGLADAEAQRLAARLLIRDESQDHRRMCAECARLSGGPGRGWVCTAPKLAQVARDLPADWVTRPQDCPGFKRAAL